MDENENMNVQENNTINEINETTTEQVNEVKENVVEATNEQASEVKEEVVEAQPIHNAEVYDETQANKPDPVNIACLVCGILSLTHHFIPYANIIPGFVFGTVAIILYIVGKGKPGKDYATGGLICGIIGLVISLFVRLVVVAFLAFFVGLING